MTRNAIFIVAMFQMSFLFLGCGSQPCKSSRDCPEGSFCNQSSVCTIQCETKEDCGLGNVCSSRGRCTAQGPSQGQEVAKEFSPHTEPSATTLDGGNEGPPPENNSPGCQDGAEKTCFQGNQQHRGIGTCKLGKKTCSHGVWSACIGSVQPTQEVCDQLDNDCNGKVDDGISCECRDGETQACGSDIGSCKKGTRTCLNNQWQACVGAVKASKELCDGLDNDCNGQVDEAFSLGKTCTVGQGECKSTGATVCNDAQDATKCDAKLIQPSTEVCDEKDNDCDGSVDEDAGCKCKSGETRPCGSTVGECNQGVQTCNQGQWQACVGDVQPTTEVCDGKDNNCDGKVDEAFPTLGKTCTAGKGSCKRQGTFVCSVNKLSAACNATPTSPSNEVCDGKDNDCDGQVDETFVDIGKACSLGVGACLSQGTMVCTTDKLKTECNAKAIQPSAEVCDGKDNDCDGQVDENITKDCYSGNQGTLNKGICKAGTQTCTLGSWTQCIGEVSHKDEICDGLDNDCDGQTDEQLTQACGTDVGECKKGTKTCTGGTWSLCIGQILPAKEVQDGKDNDCNGKIDDTFTLSTFASSKELHSESPYAQEILLSSDGKNMIIRSSYTIDFYAGNPLKKVKTVSFKGWNSLYHSKQTFFSNDQKSLYTCVDNEIHIYDSHTGTLKTKLKDHLYEISSCYITKDGKYLISKARKEQNVKVWDLEKKNHFKDFVSHKDETEVSFSPNGKYMAFSSGSERKEVTLVDTNSWQIIAILKGHTERPYEIFFSSNSKILFTYADYGKEIKAWTASSGALLSTISRTVSAGDKLSSPDGEFLFLERMSSKTIEMWKTSNGTLFKTLSGHSSTIYKMYLSPSGNMLISHSFDGSIRTWDAKTGSSRKTL